MDREEARALASRIHASVEAEDWQAARLDLVRYCVARPADGEFWYLRALVDHKLGHNELALRALSRALELDPSLEPALSLKQAIMAQQDALLDDAVVPEAAAPCNAAGPDAPLQAGSTSALDTVRVEPAGMGTMLAGRYRVVELLGRGGMGQVWRAVDTQLHDRAVAIKRVHRHLLPTEDALLRFRHEIRTLARLNHPYIVGVTDSGHDEEGFYYVMEFVAGRTLREWLDGYGQAALPGYAEILPLFTQLSRAVAFAHRHGVVHRDLKPDNIIVTDDNVVQMLDFGLAHAAGEAGMPDPFSTAGTPVYMAPEQARGEPPDPRMDIYALGVLLFELVTLRPPFMSSDLVRLIYQHQHDEPPHPSSLRADTPPELDAVILRALRKEPQARYPSVPDLLCGVQESLSSCLLPYGPRAAEGVFRQLAEAGWSDGVLTEAERAFLLSRAAEMGIARPRALEILLEAAPTS